MTIGCWTVCNLSAIVNVLVSASMFFTIKSCLIQYIFHFLAIYLLCYDDHFIDHLFASIFTLALAIQLNPYYAILFAPIFLQFRHRLLAALTLSISIISLLLALNFAIEPNSSDLLRSTLAFL